MHKRSGGAPPASVFAAAQLGAPFGHVDTAEAAAADEPGARAVTGEARAVTGGARAVTGEARAVTGEADATPRMAAEQRDEFRHQRDEFRHPSSGGGVTAGSRLRFTRPSSSKPRPSTLGTTPGQPQPPTQQPPPPRPGTRTAAHDSAFGQSSAVSHLPHSGGNPARPRPSASAVASAGGSRVHQGAHGSARARTSVTFAPTEATATDAAEDASATDMDACAGGGYTEAELDALEAEIGGEIGGDDDMDEYDRLVAEQSRRRAHRSINKSEEDHDELRHPSSERFVNESEEDHRTGGNGGDDSDGGGEEDVEGMPDEADEPDEPDEADEAMAAWREAERSLFGGLGASDGSPLPNKDRSGRAPLDPLELLADSPASVLKSERHLERHVLRQQQQQQQAPPAEGGGTRAPGTAPLEDAAGQLQNELSAELSAWAEAFERRMTAPAHDGASPDEGPVDLPFPTAGLPFSTAGVPSAPLGTALGTADEEEDEGADPQPPPPAPPTALPAPASGAALDRSVSSLDCSVSSRNEPPSHGRSSAPSRAPEEARQPPSGKRPKGGAVAGAKGSNHPSAKGSNHPGQVRINYAPPPSAASAPPPTAASAPPPQLAAVSGRGGGSFALLQAAEEAAQEMRAAEEAAHTQALAVAHTQALAETHTQAFAETDAEEGRALKTRRLSREPSSSAEMVHGDAVRQEAEAMSAVLSAKKHAEAMRAVLSAKEHAEADAARANASLLELRAQYDAMQRRYEESEAALERTRRAASEVSLELEGMRSGVEQQGAAARDGVRSREGEIANLKLEIASLRDEGAQLRRQMQRARDDAELEQKDASRRAERIEVRAVEAERDATKQAARAADAERRAEAADAALEAAEAARRRALEELRDANAKLERRRGGEADQTTSHASAQKVRSARRAGVSMDRNLTNGLTPLPHCPTDHPSDDVP